jgi:predicted metal-dependent peptidase
VSGRQGKGGKGKKGKGQQVDPWRAAVLQGRAMVAAHPAFRGFGLSATAGEAARFGPNGWVLVLPEGGLLYHPTRRARADEWAWAFAHGLLHLGLGHADPWQVADKADLAPDPAGRHRVPAQAYRAACCVAADRLLRPLKLGRPPEPLPSELPGEEEGALARRWRAQGIPESVRPLGPPDFLVGNEALARDTRFQDRFAQGIAAAATEALDAAGGSPAHASSRERGPWDQALSWFISSYPLLGAVAAGMTLVADAELARGWDISVAAVNAEAAEIYVNPLLKLSAEEWRFVLAHEMLHAALRHGERVGWRDRQLWNVACDFVVNGWLVQMGVGVMPEGLLYDPALAGLSCEAVYDRIVTDLRRMRRLATLRGRGTGDMLDQPLPRPGEAVRNVDLDEYYRNALLTGLAYHERAERGLVPAGLEQEIRALDQPPVPWDAALARWFDEHVPAAERRRSYGRASRRQAATPGIPRPGWIWPEETVRQVTFGVVLDTSGSMNTTLLGKALGAIASFAMARDVPLVRVVFCDAAAYDAGYLPAEDIARRVRVRGRGGTTLQPGISLLERAEDFPADGPILVITDGACDVLRIRREHAFLIPAGATLPFRPRGSVFRVK